MICIFEDTFFESDRFLSIAMHSLTSIELPMHIFAIYIILFQTPKSMASAKFNILELHIGYAALDIVATFLCIPYLWIPSPSGYSVGFFTFLGISTPVQWCFGLIVLMSLLVSLMSFFENRYDIIVVGSIHRSDNRNLKRCLYFLINWLCGLTAVVYIFANAPDVEIGRANVRQDEPCIPERLLSNPNYYNVNATSYFVVFIIALLFSAFFIQTVYFLILTSYHLFWSVDFALSKTTQSLQRRFFIAMLLQAIIPLSILLIPVCYYFIAWHFRYFNQKYNNFAMVAIGMNGFFTTVVMISVHHPYRSFVRRLLQPKFENLRHQRSVFLSITR